MTNIARPGLMLRPLLTGTILWSVVGCGSVALGSRPRPEGPAPRDDRAEPAATRVDPVAFYRQRGLIAHGAPMAFTGSVGVVATGGMDSSYVIVALALNSEALTFRREGETFRADYRVSLRLRRDAEVVALADATEPVRVATLRETSRADESIVFQQVLAAPPGTYALGVEVRDLGSGRTGAQTLQLYVPSFADRRLASPLPVYEYLPRTTRRRVPRLVVNPRGAALAGRDSVLDVYLEAYGQEGPSELAVALQVEGQQVWSTTVTTVAGEGMQVAVAAVPTAQVPLGTADFLAWSAGAGDTVRVPLFVGFSDDVPATTYADMLGYLEYFAAEDRLRPLRSAAPRQRAQAWAAFSRETDPVSATPEHEGLRSYFARMRQANASYAEPGVPGWQTDRGKVYLLFGEPDRVLDQFTSDAALRGRIQQWEYNAEGLTLVFEDAMGLNRWRLTRESEALVASARARRDSGS